MAASLRALTGIFVLFSLTANSPALIVGQGDGKAADAIEQGDASRINDAFDKDFSGNPPAEFPFWKNVGIVGLGTGTYIGDGWVVTAAHVGCFPFVATDGTVWQPRYATYRVLSAANGNRDDIAIFRLADRPDLPAIPVARHAATANSQVLIIGNGYTQEETPELLMLQGRAIGTLGFHTRPVRAKLWGKAYAAGEESMSNTSNGTGSSTPVFSTRFDRKPHAAQATDGDSGSPIFVYNPIAACWELTGCVAAVSHQTRYVPYGSKSFVIPLPVISRSKETPVATLDFGAFNRSSK